MGLYVFDAFDFAESRVVVETVILSEEHCSVYLRGYRFVKGEQLREIGTVRGYMINCLCRTIGKTIEES